MTPAGIECFLAVCRHKTGSRAAEALYITQSSLSTRLKILEKELGGPLFYRKKGCREMTLTPAGKEFYELALQYETLTAKMLQVCRPRVRNLRVSSFNSIGTYLLPAVYDRFLQQNPGILLDIQDMELDAAIRSIQSGTTDIAFTAGKVTDGMLVQTPVFSEPMVLIASADNCYRDPVEVSNLSLSNQVYINWSSSFVRWHRRVFGNEQPQICISMMAHLRRFVEQKDHWAIVPISVADGLARDGGICCLRTEFSLPQREIACLTAKDSKDSEDVQAFFSCLREVIAEHPDVISAL